MSLKNIQLPAQVMADLYKNLLIEDENPAVFVPAPAEEPVRPSTTETVKQAPLAAIPVAEKPAPVATPIATIPPSLGTAYKFLGNHQKQVSIIVDFAGETYLPENHLQFLTKILGACRLNLGDVAILNNSTQAIEINALKEQLHPKFVLLLGVEPTAIDLPLSFPQFKEQEYAGTRYLITPPLNELNQETASGKQLKGLLWGCLKKMFDL